MCLSFNLSSSPLSIYCLSTIKQLFMWSKTVFALVHVCEIGGARK